MYDIWSTEIRLCAHNQITTSVQLHGTECSIMCWCDIQSYSLTHSPDWNVSLCKISKAIYWLLSKTYQ